MSLKCQITRTAEISLEKEGYIKFKIIPGSVVDAEDALDNFLVLKTLSGGKKMLKLIDLRGKWKFTKKAREVSKKNISPENTIARAYITDSVFTKLLFIFFKSFDKQGAAQAFFTDENEAIKWLLSQR